MGAILGKELRSRMRGWRAMVVLTLYLAALGGLAVLVLWLATMQLQVTGASQMATLGSVLFGLLAGLQLVLVVFIAPGLTAGAIAGERERQTIDLLLCTRLSSLAIVVGKLLASLSYALLLLLASLPIFSLAFLFGGVSPRQLGLVFALSLATAVTIGSVGLFISSLFRRGTAATVLSYVAAFLLAFASGPAAAIVAAIEARGGPPQTHWLAYLNPLGALASILIGPSAGGMGGFPLIFFGVYSAPVGLVPAAGPAVQEWPFWLYHFAVDAALILFLVLASTAAVRPPRLRLRRGG